MTRVRRARPDEVHVWRARLDQPAHVIAAMTGMLSGDERARADRFRSPLHRDRFILCRGAQRDILGAYSNVAPPAIVFRYTDYGKPYLDGITGSAQRIRFNTSNSGELAVFAVTAEREIGVDVEAERKIPDVLALARRFFSAAEYAALCARPADTRQQAFLTCWTRKEAYIKAVGMGISMSLADFDVAVGPSEPAALLETRPDPAVAGRWDMRSLDVGEGYTCTLVSEGVVGTVHLLDWHPGESAG